MRGVETKPVGLKSLIGLVPVVDLDFFVYSCAFSAQEGRGEEAVAQPVRFALANARKAVEKILKTCDVENNGDDYRLYLTGTGNYRTDVATIIPYKSKRPAKPIHYQAVRDYFVEFWGAEIVDGMEADDKVAIEYLNSYPENGVLVSLDKDHLQIPGLHLCPKNLKAYTVDEVNANRAFWSQMITGDAVDSIQGLPKHGPAAAERTLKDKTTWDEMYFTVRDLYGRVFESGCPRHDGSTIPWLDAFHENAELLYILRFDGDTWYNHRKEGEQTGD